MKTHAIYSPRGGRPLRSACGRPLSQLPNYVPVRSGIPAAVTCSLCLRVLMAWHGDPEACWATRGYTFEGPTVADRLTGALAEREPS